MPIPATHETIVRSLDQAQQYLNQINPGVLTTEARESVHAARFMYIEMNRLLEVYRRESAERIRTGDEVVAQTMQGLKEQNGELLTRIQTVTADYTHNKTEFERIHRDYREKHSALEDMRRKESNARASLAEMTKDRDIQRQIAKDLQICLDDARRGYQESQRRVAELCTVYPVVESASIELTRLKNFKTYVHKRFDDLGAPQFSDHDCRFGSRLDWLLQKPSSTMARAETAERQLNVKINASVLNEKARMEDREALRVQLYNALSERDAAVKEQRRLSAVGENMASDLGASEAKICQLAKERDQLRDKLAYVIHSADCCPGMPGGTEETRRHIAVVAREEVHKLFDGKGIADEKARIQAVMRECLKDAYTVVEMQEKIVRFPNLPKG